MTSNDPILTIIGWATASVVVVCSSLYLWVRPKYVDPAVPGPRRHFLFGVTFTKDFIEGVDFDWPRWPELSLLLSRRWNYVTWGGPTLNIGFGGAFFNIVSPECLEHILKQNFSNYVKGKLVRSFDEIMGKEFAFSVDGESWKFYRKITVALLNRQTVQYGASVLSHKLTQVERTIDGHMGEVFDLQKLAYDLIIETFVKIGFGIDLNVIGSKNASPFAEALDELNLLIHQRFDDYLWEIKQRFSIGEREQRVRVLTKIIDQFAQEIIQGAREQADEDKPDIVSRYLEYCKAQNQAPPTSRELRNFVIGFVFAGRDTTAAAMTWTMFELTKNTKDLTRLRQEVDMVSQGQSLTLEMVQNMPFLHACIMEALRLHPPAPENFRFAVTDDILPDGTKIPANALVMFSINTINKSDQVWLDPEEFKPERFYETKEPSPFSFPTFSGGPRMCPGKGLAMMELKMAVAVLVTKYHFEDATGHDGSYHWTTVMSMKGGFPVKAVRRT